MVLKLDSDVQQIHLWGQFVEQKLILKSDLDVQQTQLWDQIVEQKLMLSSNFRCDQILIVTDMIWVTLCCST